MVDKYYQILNVNLKILKSMVIMLNDAGHQNNKLIKAVHLSTKSIISCDVTIQWNLGDQIRGMSILFGIRNLIYFSGSHPFHRYYNLPLDSF